MKLKTVKKLEVKEKTLLCTVSLEDVKKGKNPFQGEAKKAFKYLLDKKIVKSKKHHITVDYLKSSKGLDTIVFLVLDKKKELNGNSIRNSFAKAFKKLKSLKIQNFSILITKETEKYLQEITEALGLVDYNTATFKTGKTAKKNEKKMFGKISIIKSSLAKADKELIKRGEVISEAVKTARDLVNFPPNIVNPSYLEKICRKIAKENKYKIKVWKNKDLEKKKMGGILAVNRGSTEENARLITLEYKPRGAKDKPIVLVGKGITFDTGGYNIKPTGYMEDMHMDMAGAAAVIGTFHLLKKLGVKKHVIGLVPTTENMISATAYKPSEIVTTYSGQTVEILNTDAEGRMILADALTYGSEFDPKFMVSLATLTGAVMVALGTEYAGVFSNKNELAQKVQKLGEECDELTWHLPIHKNYTEAMKSKKADLRNIDLTREAGSSKAAAFLENFVNKKDWIHLDIAGAAYVKNPKPYDYKDATGYGVRLLTELIES